MSVIDPLSEIPLRRCPVAVLDYETTGVNPMECQPVSVSITHAELGVAGSEKLVMDQIIDPCIPIPDGAAKIHGITAEKVWGKPKFEDVLPEILKHLDGRVLMAYNLPYDWTITCLKCEEMDIDPPPFGAIDPLPFVWVVDKYHGGRGAKSLTQVCARRGITFDAHQSAADTLATVQVTPLIFRDYKKEHGQHHVFKSVQQLWLHTCKLAIAREKDFFEYRKGEGKSLPDCPWHQILELDAPRA